LGDRNHIIRMFGTYQGNFYAAVIYAVNKLIQGDDRPTSPSVKPDTLPRFRGLVLPLVDTVADMTRRRKLPCAGMMTRAATRRPIARHRPHQALVPCAL